MSTHYTSVRNPGYIYVIACGEYQKIGQSNNPMRRMIRMRTDNPYPLRMLVVLSTLNMDAAEHFIHQHYSPYHYDGEWFCIPQEPLSWVLTHVDIDSEIEAAFLDLRVADNAFSFAEADITKIRQLLGNGWTKTRILTDVFGCTRGGSSRYRKLSIAFDELMQTR